MSKNSSDTMNESKAHTASKLDLPETGVSAKKAEADLAASSECAGPDVGQAASLGVGCMGAEAPHLENENFASKKDEKSPTAAAKQDQKAEKAENCDKHETAPKANSKCESGSSAEKCDESEKAEKSGEKADKSEKSAKSNKSEPSDKENSDNKAPVIDLGVMGGLAILAVEQTAKVVQDVAKNWEDKVDATALKAHETIESAQRAIKDPIGETLKQVEHLTHPAKNDKQDQKGKKVS